jgi:putative ABC transport system substrate-binding protein
LRSVKRRVFLRIVGASAIAAAGSVRAAPARPELPRVIFLDDTEAPQAERLQLFRQSLTLSGLPSDRIVLEVVEMPGSDPRALRRELAACLRRDPSAFVTAAANIAINGLPFMARVPLVFATQVDPVKLGIQGAAGGLRPNVTGFNYDVSIDMKAFEVLADAFPAARRVALVADRNWMEYHHPNLDVDEIRSRFGITIDLVIPAAPRNVEWEFERLLPSRADACYVPNSDVTFFSTPALIGFLQRHRVPHLFASDGALRLGALMSYGVRKDSHWEPMATMLRHILSGAEASEMPFERAREFVLGVNASQAAKMGVAIPKHILRRANLVV